MFSEGRIFLSGTDYVKDIMFQLYTEVNLMGFESVWFKKESFPHYFGVNAMDICLEAVKTCDMFVLVLDQHAGLEYKKSGKTITEVEFDVAFKLDLPILVFIRERVWHQSRSYHKKRKELRRALSDEEYKSICLDGDQNIYEFIERLQHLKKGKDSKVPWIEKFEFADKIVRCIRQKWLIDDDFQEMTINELIRAISNRDKKGITDKSHIPISISNNLKSKLTKLSDKEHATLLGQLEQLKSIIREGAENPLLTEKIKSSNSVSYKVSATQRVILRGVKDRFVIDDIVDYKNPFIFGFSKVSSVKQISVNSLMPKRLVKIALVSLPFPDSYESMSYKIDSDSASRIQFPTYSIDYAKRLEKIYHSSLSYAINSLRADIICFSEFAFPYNYNSGKDGFNTKLAKSIKGKVDRNNCVIVCGSYVDPNTFLNTTLIMYPGCEKFGLKYHKQTSNSSLGEFTYGPPQRVSYIFNIFGLRVGVLVGTDIMDFSTIAPVIKSVPQLDLILVPSLSSDSQRHSRFAISVAEAISGFVGVAGGKKRGVDYSSAFYKFDESIRIRNNKVFSQEDDFDIITCNISVRDLHVEKRERSISHSTNEKIAWLFDLNPITIIN